MKLTRCSGVLLHPTSLPSRWGVGDLGPSAFRFLDLLEKGKQSIWEVLPLTPVDAQGSPYSSRSLFACNALLLSPEKLVEDGYLRQLPEADFGSFGGGVDFGAALEFKARLVDAAFEHSFSRVRLEDDYSRFRERNADWLDDFALFDAIAKEQRVPWFNWPSPLRDRDQKAINEALARLRSTVERAVFSQYLFERQWSSLASYARSKRMEIMGDIPFYVLRDSADVWVNRDLFKLGEQGQEVFVGGVPPDYFSKTGQRWGNPVYRWERMEESGYDWWRRRVTRNLEFADILRLDHFRGYVSYWEIPAEKRTAVEGRWVDVPQGFLSFVASTFPSLPFVAEDLGMITDEVIKARERLGVPGMRVLQFAFDGSKDNVHLPRNFGVESFAYTGTHDTNTARGWFEEEATTREKEIIRDFFGHEVTGETIAREFIKAAMESSAEASVVPMQDLLGLGSDARMNNPAKGEGSWRWRVSEDSFEESLFASLREETSSSGRG